MFFPTSLFFQGQLSRNSFKEIHVYSIKIQTTDLTVHRGQGKPVILHKVIKIQKVKENV